MGELNGDQLEYLYDNVRVQLSAIDFVVAAEAWQRYVNDDAEKLKQFIEANSFWANLHCLKPALEAQVKRLQKNENGLNHIEQKLFDIYNIGITDKAEIYSLFWKTEKIFGMGDLEVNIYLQRLYNKGLITKYN